MRMQRRFDDVICACRLCRLRHLPAQRRDCRRAGLVMQLFVLQAPLLPLPHPPPGS